MFPVYRRWSADVHPRPAAGPEAVLHPRQAWPRLRDRLAGEYGAKFAHIGALGRLRPVAAKTAFPSHADFLPSHRPLGKSANCAFSGRTVRAC